MKIAIFGKMRSGKNTVADILMEEYGFNQFAFGDGIGAIIDEYFPDARKSGKPREHYQHIGQQLRVLDEDVWVNCLLRRVKLSERLHRNLVGMGTKEGEYKVVVTDGRQLNEAKKLKEAGYLIIKVTAPEEIRIERMKASGDNFTKEQLNHETELQVDLIESDIEIFNDGTPEELENMVKSIMRGVDIYE